MDKIFIEKINYEISQIDEQFNICKPLLDLCKLKKLDAIETMAAGSFIHSIYNGIEKTLVYTFKGINETIPNDINWHTKLLEKAFSKTETGEFILNNEYKETLNKYMRFRHLFRHTYNYKLDINKLKPLIDGSNDIWEKIKLDINNFIKKQITKNKEPMKNIKYYSAAAHELKNLISKDTKITELEKYDPQTKKLTYKNKNGTNVYVLQRKKGSNIDIWQFSKDFGKKQAVQFIQDWDEGKREGRNNTIKKRKK